VTIRLKWPETPVPSTETASAEHATRLHLHGRRKSFFDLSPIYK
jgi:hypothetical protein